MKLNQATAAAAAFLSISAATLASSSSAASASSYDMLKDKIAPLLASKPNHYFHRMLQGLSDECMFDPDSRPKYNSDNVPCPEAVTMEENTITVDRNTCETSFREACTVDNGTLVEENWGDIIGDCTTVMGESVKIIYKESFECVTTSCVTEWESVEGQMSDEMVKEMESHMSENLAAYFSNEAGDVECKIDSSSTVGSSVGTGEGSAVGSSSADQPNGAGAGAGAAESLSAAGSSAGTATGMLALTATSAAAALFIF